MFRRTDTCQQGNLDVRQSACHAVLCCLQDYPEGPGVLLELVQNADDAGATKAAFLLDMRQHGTSSLLGPGMAAFQGPALLAYNNAIFSPGRQFVVVKNG